MIVLAFKNEMEIKIEEQQENSKYKPDN